MMRDRHSVMMTNYLEPHWDRAALIVVDIQRDFLDDGTAPIAGTTDILSQLSVLTAGFREAGRPIAHVIRLYDPANGDVDLARREDLENRPGLVAPGSVGSQLPSLLFDAPVQLDAERLLMGEPQVIGRSEIVLFKPRWSAFYRTQLEGWLREQDVDTVVVVGCNLPNCPRATLFDASERDFRAVLVSDAVSQCTPERLADLALIGVSVATTDHVLRALQASAPHVD